MIVILIQYIIITKKVDGYMKRKSGKTILVIFILIILIVAGVFGYEYVTGDTTIIDLITGNNSNRVNFKMLCSNDLQTICNTMQTKYNSDKQSVNVEYADTMNIVDKLNSGELYDAIYMPNDFWLDTIDKDKVKISDTTKTATTPLILSLRKNKAIELGLINKEVTTKDIVDMINNKTLTFNMSNPSTTNSGISTYMEVLSNLKGNSEELNDADLQNDDLKNSLKIFFSGLSRTSGDEDFLNKSFINGDYDAIFTYESTILNIDKTLKDNGNEPLYAIYPSDGVTLSNISISYVDNGDESKKDIYDTIKKDLTSKEGQEKLNRLGFRTKDGKVSDKYTKDVFKEDWGIDTKDELTTVEYPDTDVIESAVDLYQNELRKPVHVVFCLDYSGSMTDDENKNLIDAMQEVLSDADDVIKFNANDKIDIIPFGSSVGVTFKGSGSDKDAILRKVQEYHSSGSSALYSGIISSVEDIKDESDDYDSSVILLVRKKSNIGSIDDLKNEYDTLNKNIPIYVVSSGEADDKEVEAITTLTNGKSFDGKADLKEAFKNVRAYN